MSTTARPPIVAQPVPTAAGHQTIQEYGAALLRYAMHRGPYSLDGEQLRLADAAAQLAVMQLPTDLTRDDGTEQLNRALAETRTRIQREQLRRAQQWARIAAQLAGQDQDPDQDQEIPDQDPGQGPPQSDADRAATLLRAALILIMGQGPGPGSNGNGGQRSPLIPPGPKTPPRDGAALSQPGRPSSTRRGDDDGIDF